MKGNIILYTGNFNIFDMNAAGKRVLMNCYALSSAGFNVVSLGMPSTSDNSSEEHIEINGVDIYSYPSSLVVGKRTSIVKMFEFFRKFVLELKECPIYIIFYGSPGLALLNRWIIRFAQKNGIKVVADVVDWLPSNSGSILHRTVKTIDNWYLKGCIYKKIDGVFSISSWFDQYYSKKKVKSLVVPPLSDIHDVRLCNNKEKSIVYAGTPFRLGTRISDINQLKDRIDLIIILLSACEYRDFSLDIYGFCEEDLLYSLPKLDYPISILGDRIRFHGKQAMEIVYENIRNADFTILFRSVNKATSAGFPSKVSESLGANVPVITNKTSDISKYVSENIECYFVDIDNFNNATKKISSILSQSGSELYDKKMNICERRTFYYGNYSESMRNFLNTL